MKYPESFCDKIWPCYCWTKLDFCAAKLYPFKMNSNNVTYEVDYLQIHAEKILQNNIFGNIFLNTIYA